MKKEWGGPFGPPLARLASGPLQALEKIDADGHQTSGQAKEEDGLARDLRDNSADELEDPFHCAGDSFHTSGNTFHGCFSFLPLARGFFM